MEPESDTKIAIIRAKHNLMNNLGEEWMKYLSYLKKWFRNEWTKETFDSETRMFLTPSQISYHNKFLLEILNSVDITSNTEEPIERPIHQEAEEIVVETNQSNKKRKREIYAFHPPTIEDFLSDSESTVDPVKMSNLQLRYAAKELFIPDSTMIYGRFLAGAWENGLESVDDSAMNMIAAASAIVMKNIITSCIKQRKNYRVTSDRKFYYDIGCQFKDPNLRNTLTRQKVDDEMLELDVFARKSSDDTFYLSSYEECDHPRRKITLYDIYKTLRDRNVIPSHSINTMTMEKIISNITP